MSQSSKSPETIAQELLRMKARLEAGPGETEAPRARGMGFFEAILHHAGEPVAVLKDGVHIFVNPPYAALVGRSREELLSLRLESLVAGDSREALIQALEDRRTKLIQNLRAPDQSILPAPGAPLVPAARRVPRGRRPLPWPGRSRRGT